MEKDNLVLKYYILDESSQTLTVEYILVIQEDNLEIPINIQFEIVDGSILEIVTTRKITEKVIKSKYEEILKEFKKNNVFQGERG